MSTYHARIPSRKVLKRHLYAPRDCCLDAPLFVDIEVDVAEVLALILPPIVLAELYAGAPA
jgi:hypothetical protein